MSYSINPRDSCRGIPETPGTLEPLALYPPLRVISATARLVYNRVHAISQGVST